MMMMMTVDVSRLKMRSITAMEVAEASRSPNRVDVELCQDFLNLNNLQSCHNLIMTMMTMMTMMVMMTMMTMMMMIKTASPSFAPPGSPC